MEKALQSVREAHQAELDNERYYQHQNYLAMQDQIKSLEEKNKQLSREKASIAVETQRKLNVAQRYVNQMTLVNKHQEEEHLKSNDRLETLLEKNQEIINTKNQHITSLVEKNKNLSKDWATEHKFFK